MPTYFSKWVTTSFVFCFKWKFHMIYYNIPWWKALPYKPFYEIAVHSDSIAVTHRVTLLNLIDTGQGPGWIPKGARQDFLHEVGIKKGLTMIKLDTPEEGDSAGRPQTCHTLLSPLPLKVPFACRPNVLRIDPPGTRQTVRHKIARSWYRKPQ